MYKAIAITNPLQQNALGGLFQKTDVAQGHNSPLREKKPNGVMVQIGCSTEIQPGNQPKIQPDEQPIPLIVCRIRFYTVLKLFLLIY